MMANVPVAQGTSAKPIVVCPGDRNLADLPPNQNFAPKHRRWPPAPLTLSRCQSSDKLVETAEEGKRIGQQPDSKSGAP
jgi:hypothetical protein